MRMMIVTGGTGGHIYPALALADAAKQRYGEQAQIAFVGNDDRMEASLIPEKGYPFYPLHTSGLVGGVRVYSKFSSGDPDASKSATALFLSCVFLVIVGTVLRSFFL